MTNARIGDGSDVRRDVGATGDGHRELETRAANRFWWPVMLAIVVVGVLAVVAAVSGDGDRGVRGPADQAAPDAPPAEKVPPSAR